MECRLYETSKPLTMDQFTDIKPAHLAKPGGHVYTKCGLGSEIWDAQRRVCMARTMPTIAKRVGLGTSGTYFK